MSDEAVVFVPLHPGQEEELVLPPAEAQPPALQVPTPSAEEARAVEAVFAGQPKPENEVVAGLVGLYAGAVMLQNLAMDALHQTGPEEKPRLRRRSDEPDEEQDR